MMLAILAESALRSLLLGGVVWIGLNLLRVRNPHVHMTCWLVVLMASLSMPFLMHSATVSITLEAPPVPATQPPWPAAGSLPEAGPLLQPSDGGLPAAAHASHYHAADWLAAATAVYAIVAGMLLLRLALGLALTWRLVLAARPLRAHWTANWRVRVSDVIGGPVTFGSTILLPPQCIDWDFCKRQAVLAHEGAHVVNRDFYVLLLASLNRAVFWFSPFAWWQLARLAELAELISDARALETVEDRLSYAEILLDLVQRARRVPMVLEMARACTVRARMEHILAAGAAPARLSWRKRVGTAAALLPVVVISAGSIAYTTTPASTPAFDGTGAAVTAATSAQHVSFYSFGRASIFTVFREGDDFFGQLSGQRKLRLAASGDGTFTYPAATGRITLAVGNERQPIAPVLSRDGHDMQAARIADTSWQGAEAEAGPLDSYVGWYQLTPIRVLAVTRNGTRLSVQETGQSKVALAAYGSDAFSGDRDKFVVFLRDGQARVTQVLLQDRSPAPGSRRGSPRRGRR